MPGVVTAVPWVTVGWAVAGVLLGGLLAGTAVRRAPRHPGLRLEAGCAAATGLAFGILAARFDGVEQLAFSFLAWVGVALSAIDLVERRLPARLVLPSCGMLVGLLGVEAFTGNRLGDLLTAFAAAFVLALTYLAVALASNGGLGSGDVMFGGLLGVAMGWQGWSTVLTGSAVAWIMAAAVLLTLRWFGRRPDTLPMGPFLLTGALVAIASG